MNALLLAAALLAPAAPPPCPCPEGGACPCADCKCADCCCDFCPGKIAGKRADGYSWTSFSNGDPNWLCLNKDGKQVGSYRLAGGDYLDIATGAWAECPCDAPTAAEVKKLLKASRPAPQPAPTYYQPQTFVPTVAAPIRSCPT